MHFDERESKYIPSILITVILTACSSSSTNSPQYETLTSNADTTSTLGGVSTLKRGEISLSVTETSGELQHNNSMTSFTGGGYSINAAVPNDGILRDGNTVLVDITDFQVSNSYDYVQTIIAGVVQPDGSLNTNEGFLLGVHGIITSIADVPAPNSGQSATYNGEAFGNYSPLSGGGETNLTNGAASITANFDSGTVDVNLSNFTSVGNGIDTVNIANMEIDGNTFTGGDVTITGANTNFEFIEESAGAFFGYDNAISAPDEVGGVYLGVGEDGVLLLQYVAD